MNYMDKVKKIWHKNPFFFQVVPGVLLVFAFIFDSVGRIASAVAFILILVYIAKSKEITDDFDRRTREIVDSIFKK